MVRDYLWSDPHLAKERIRDFAGLGWMSLFTVKVKQLDDIK